MSLSVWRDEAKGLINGMKPEDLADQDDPNTVDLTSDFEADSTPSRSKRKGQGEPSKSSSPTTDVDINMDMNMDTSSRPPSSATEVDDDEFDIDTMMREEEERLEKMRAAAASASTSLVPSASATVTYRNADADDDEAMWAEVDGLGEESIPVPPSANARQPFATTQPSVNASDEDDDMWDLMGDTGAAPYIPPPVPPIDKDLVPQPDVEPVPPIIDENTEEGRTRNSPTEAKSLEPITEQRPTNDEDWDDMYL